MPGLGVDSWVSLVEESTYGTTPGSGESYLCMVSDTVKNERSVDPVSSLCGVSNYNTVLGGAKIGGDITFEMLYEGLLLFLKHGLGGYAYSADTPVAGANTHAITLADELPTGLSFELCRGDTPTGDAFLYQGGKVDALDFQFDTGSIMRLVATMIAQSEDPDATASGTPSYPDWYPVLWHEFNGTLTFCGESITEFVGGNIKLENNLTRDRFLMHDTIREPVRGDRRNVSGSIKLEYEDLGLYNKYIAGTTGAMSLTFSSSYYVTGSTPYSMNFSLPKVQLLPAPTPNVSSAGVIELDVPFIGLHSGSSSDALSITFISGEATL